MNILIGSVGISNYFGCVSPVYYVFKETTEADLRFINYIFSTREFQKELRKYANGILEIRYLDEKCGEIDAIITEKKEQFSTLNEYKKSLIYEYVTGKKEVPAI